MSSSFSSITRFGEPTKMDTAKFKTICRVSSSPESFDIYLQISHDEEKPYWTYMGAYSSQMSDEHIFKDVHEKLVSGSTPTNV